MYMMLIEGELKPGKRDEFLSIWSSQILPLLKKQDGFVDEILLSEQGSQQLCGLSFWKTRKHWEHYLQNVFPETKNLVQHLMHGKPVIRNFDVVAAETFKVVAGIAA